MIGALEAQPRNYSLYTQRGGAIICGVADLAQGEVEPKLSDKTESGQIPEATEHIAEATRILNGLREQSLKHPDLDAAIGRLELALSILTTQTGGML
jgi:hypothetical protein